MSEVTRLPKPNMRNLMRNFIRNTFIYSFGVGMAAGAGWWYVAMTRANRIEERMINEYDPEKDYERMKNLGLFQHVRPADESKAYYPAW